MSSSAAGLWTGKDIDTKNPTVFSTGYELDNGLIFAPGTEEAKVTVFDNVLHTTDGTKWHYLTFVPTDQVLVPTYLTSSL